MEQSLRTSGKSWLRLPGFLIALAFLSTFSVSAQSERQPRKLLTSRYSKQLVGEVLLGRADFRPFPRPGDERWKLVADELRKAHISAAEQYLGREWPSLTATRFLDFVRTGDRSRYQAQSFGRRDRLGGLVLAEVFENKGRFVDEILNGVWLICEESYWGVPAHLNLQKAGSGLPDTSEPTVDLFAAETGSLLAWTWYLVGDKLEKISPLIGKRIYAEIDRRILSPNLERSDFGWMGFSGRPVNNWNPWINSNWLAAVLLMEDEAKRRAAAVHKIMDSLERFLDGYPPDGGCDEGPGYWNRAGGSLFDCLELLKLASNGKIDIFAEPLVREMGRYICRVYIGRDYFVNFADASARAGVDAPVVFRYGKAVSDERMMRFASYLASRGKLGSGYLRGSYGGLTRRLPAFFVLSELVNTRPEEPLLRDVWMPGLQVMCARDKENSIEGFFVAAQGGHNAESHNHNDVGNFVLYVDGQPAIIDAGVETYTRKTFSSERYNIWTMQSGFHNLPTINGTMQQEGREFAARNVAYRADEDRVEFGLDIAGAYPASAEVKSWVRKIALNRGTSLQIVDEFELKSYREPSEWNLMTPCAVDLPGSGQIELRLAGGGRVALRFDPSLLIAKLRRIPLDDSQLRGVWGDHLNRITLTARSRDLKGRVAFELNR